MPIAQKRKPDAEEQFEKWYEWYLYHRGGVPGIGDSAIKGFMLDAYMQGRKDERNQ